MELDSFERDFGLRVALNLVHPDSLKSVDARTFEQLTVMTRSQTSRAAPLETFRVSQIEDILKAVTGTPRDAEFGSRITGADAAKVTYAPVLLSLHEKCEQLINAYTSEAYKERFAFIDDLRTVRDRPQIAQLNARLLTQFAAAAFGNTHMAPPEVTDVRDIEHFAFSDAEDERVQELDIQEACDRASAAGDLSVEHFKKTRVGVTYRGGDEVHYLWTAFDCIVTGIRDGDRLSVLSGGTSYQLEGPFAEQVARAAEHRAAPLGFLPAAVQGELEDDYNARAAGEPGLHLLHQCWSDRPALGRPSNLQTSCTMGEALFT